MINTERLCPGCMNDNGGEKICPICGYDSASRNPDICLMDEPSSALDALHEKELLHTLQTAYAGKTLLLISHRSSTLTGCSRILQAGELKCYRTICK